MTNHSTNSGNRNRFRIIGGEWRSRKLGFPGDVEGLRPTADQIRETLFNWLQMTIAGAHCLDLFAGSGALSFEALSRGAASVTALDLSPKVTSSLRENCSILSCKNLEIIGADAMQWLRKQSGKAQYDVVFLDPPYRLNLLQDCLDLLVAGNFVNAGGMIYLESDRTLESLAFPAGCRLVKAKKAGQVFYGVCEIQMK